MLIVVGAHSRKVGKTSIIGGLIRSLPRMEWTALKISSNRDGASRPRAFQFEQEKTSGGHCDTARYLQAGAKRSYWLRASEAQLPAAMPLVRDILDESRNVVIESNRILDYLDPDVYLLALDYSIIDFKQTARRFFTRADAYVLVDRWMQAPRWTGIPLNLLGRRPVFSARPPSWANSQITRFMESGPRSRRGLTPTCCGSSRTETLPA
jgi:hypothetical protein